MAPMVSLVTFPTLGQMSVEASGVGELGLDGSLIVVIVILLIDKFGRCDVLRPTPLAGLLSFPFGVHFRARLSWSFSQPRQFGT